MSNKSTLIFSSKDLDWELKNRQLKEIERLWKSGMGVRYISMFIKRNPHVVFLALYEMWMDGKINDIDKALPKSPNDGSLLVPGKEQIKQEAQKRSRKVV